MRNDVKKKKKKKDAFELNWDRVMAYYAVMGGYYVQVSPKLALASLAGWTKRCGKCREIDAPTPDRRSNLNALKRNVNFDNPKSLVARSAKEGFSMNLIPKKTRQVLNGGKFSRRMAFCI